MNNPMSQDKNTPKTESNPEKRKFAAAAEQLLQNAHESLNELTTILRRYREAATEGGRQKVLEELSADYESVRQYVSQAADKVRTDVSTNEQVERIQQILNTVTTKLAEVSKNVRENDSEIWGKLKGISGTVSELVSGALEELTYKRRGLVEKGTMAREVAQQKVMETAEAVKSHPAMQSAYAAVDQFRERVAQHPGLASARDILTNATTELKGSVDELNRAPLAEKPVVAGLEALKLARNAVNTASAVVQRSELSQTIIDRIYTTRDRALQAVRDATAALQVWREQLTTKATEWLSNVQEIAVRKAAEIDNSYNVIDNVMATAAQLDDTYSISKRFGNLATQYQVQERAQAALNRAQELDTNYTGGKGTSLVQSGLQLASQGWEASVAYANTLQDQFNEAKGGKTSSVTANNITSEATEA